VKKQKFTYIPPEERTAAPSPAEQLPPNIHNAYWFQGFNAASWQICLGSPLILFARELGAPAVVLGLLAGLSPLTSLLQLFVAPHAERIGYRNLMVKGWTSRVMTLIFLALLPLAVGHLAQLRHPGAADPDHDGVHHAARDCHLFVVALDDGHRAAGAARPVFKP
jgi:hypothetical protein